jgi:hypothetical protein
MAQHPDKPEHISGRPVQGEPAPATPSPMGEPGLRFPVQKPVDLRLPWWQYPITAVLFAVILVPLLVLGFGIVISMANWSATPTSMAYKATIFPTGQVWETKESKPLKK